MNPNLATLHLQQVMQQVMQKVGAKKALLIDVRELEEWQEGHIDSALFLPLSAIHRDPKESASSLPSDKDLYLYCHMGGRAKQAEALLKPFLPKISALSYPYKLIKDNAQLND